MTAFQIVEAKPYHCGQMVRRLRVEHDRTLIEMGINTHRELRKMFDGSCYRRAWLIDGELAALGGVYAPYLSTTGFLWLALSQWATRFPMAVVREARRQLDEIMIVKRELATTILPKDAAALRFAVFLGFHVSDDGEGARAYTHDGRRMLMEYARSNDACRFARPEGTVIAMGYHHDGAA